jgi:hypothetical protein
MNPSVWARDEKQFRPSIHWQHYKQRSSFGACGMKGFCNPNYISYCRQELC